MKKTLSILAGISICVPTITSTVSCKLFNSKDNSNSPEKPTEVKRPFWIPDVVYDQNDISHNVDIKDGDLWKNYYYTNSLSEDIIQSYMRKIIGLDYYNFLFLKNYHDFNKIFNNNSKEFVSNLITSVPEVNDMSEWNFSGIFRTTNFNASGEELFNKVIKIFDSDYDNHFLVINVQENYDKNHNLSDLKLTYFYFIKQNGVLKDYFGTSITEVKQFYYKQDTYINNKEAYIKYTSYVGLNFIDEQWIYNLGVNNKDCLLLF